MKKMKYIWMLFLMLPFSCVDNNSRYGDIDIDEIKIGGIEDYREIEIGEKLTIIPTITTKFGEKSNLSYVWYKYNQEQTIADTLSHERNLDVIIGDVLPGVETTLVLKVIDNNTGVYALYRSKFKTLGKYAGGTLMLYQNDGQYDLGMLKKDGTTLYENIYSIANGGEKLGSESKRILLTKSYPQNLLAHKAVVVTCDDRTGGVYLDPDVLVRKSYMREKFLFNEDLPDKLVITANYNNQTEDFLIVNGQVYGRPFGNNDVADWNPQIIFMAEPSAYSAAEYVVQPSVSPFYASPVFYDNLNGRFMVNMDGGYFSFISGSADDYSQFDPSSFGKNVELMASGYKNSALSQDWALMKDTEKGEFILLTFEFVTDYSSYPSKWSFKSNSRKTIARGDCPGLYAANFFRPGTKALVDSDRPWKMGVQGISDVLFYLSENRLYAFNVNTGAEGVIINGDEENYTLTGADCTLVPWPTADAPNATAIQLTLAIKDRALTGKQGGIAVYKLNDIGGLSAQKVYAKAGFCDEVISTIEKQE